VSTTSCFPQAQRSSSETLLQRAFPTTQGAEGEGRRAKGRRSEGKKIRRGEDQKVRRSEGEKVRRSSIQESVERR
jgi:hypothetical protein